MKKIILCHSICLKIRQNINFNFHTNSIYNNFHMYFYQIKLIKLNYKKGYIIKTNIT